MSVEATPNAPITLSELQALINRVDALEKEVQRLQKLITSLNELGRI